MNRKILYLGAFIVVGLVITNVAVANLQQLTEKKHKLVLTRLENTVVGMNMMKAITLKPVIRGTTSGILDSTPIYTGYTPTVAADTSNVCLGYQDEQSVCFTGSVDGGTTWPENVASYQIDDIPESPDVDSCGDGRFIGGMVPNPMDNDGSVLYKWQITDLTDFSDTGYGLTGWIWSDVGSGYTDFVDVAVAGYTAEDPSENTWAFGVHTMQGDHGGVGPQPLLSYQFQEDGYAWIYYFGDDMIGGESTSVDIDPATLYMYGVWNYFDENTSQNELFIEIMDFSSWEDYQGYLIHPEIGGYTLATNGSDNEVDISARNGNVIIVSERDGQIVSYSSMLGFNDEPVETVIDTTGESPRISHYNDNSATCVYIKDGALYSSVTEDGGRTWSTPVKQSGSENVVIGDVGGVGIVYEADNTIYYTTGGGSYPIIQIDSVKGGFGIQVEISNTGTGDANDLPYAITATGGILNLINKKTEGTIDIPAGASQKISLPMIIGLGKVTIEVTAGSASRTVQGTQLLVYTLL